MRKQTAYHIGMIVCFVWAAIYAYWGMNPGPFLAAGWVCWTLAFASGNEEVMT